MVVVKDTTVAYVVSYPDLMQNARVLITNYDALVSVYLVIAVYLHPHTTSRSTRTACLCFAQDRRDHHPLTLYHFES